MRARRAVFSAASAWLRSWTSSSTTHSSRSTASPVSTRTAPAATHPRQHTARSSDVYRPCEDCRPPGSLSCGLATGMEARPKQQQQLEG